MNYKGRCVISHIPYALKGQKLLAQGNTPVSYTHLTLPTILLV